MYVVFHEQIFERKTLGGEGHRNQGKVVLDKTSPLAVALNGQAFGKVGPEEITIHSTLKCHFSTQKMKKKKIKEKVLMPVLPNMNILHFMLYNLSDCHSSSKI